MEGLAGGRQKGAFYAAIAAEGSAVFVQRAANDNGAAKVFRFRAAFIERLENVDHPPSSSCAVELVASLTGY
jgi:hypothetical protein